MTRIPAITILSAALLSTPALADDGDVSNVDSDLERPSELIVTLPKMNATEASELAHAFAFVHDAGEHTQFNIPGRGPQ